MSTIGHPAAIRRLARTLPDAGDVKAVAMASVAGTSLHCGKRGLERDSKYLVALLGGRLLILRPLVRPDPAAAVMLDFAKGTYRVNDVQVGSLNTSFVVARPYGNVRLRVSRSASYSVNDQVVDLLVAAARAAERSATRSPAQPLHAAGDVRVFSRMCAAYGPGAERATAVAEAWINSGGGKKRWLHRDPALLLAAFPDRLVLLDPRATTHVGSTPLAQFNRGAMSVELGTAAGKYMEMTVRDANRTLAVRLNKYGIDRIDEALRDALLALGEPRVETD